MATQNREKELDPLVFFERTEVIKRRMMKKVVASLRQHRRRFGSQGLRELCDDLRPPLSDGDVRQIFKGRYDSISNHRAYNLFVTFGGYPESVMKLVHKPTKEQLVAWQADMADVAPINEALSRGRGGKGPSITVEGHIFLRALHALTED